MKKIFYLHPKGFSNHHFLSTKKATKAVHHLFDNKSFHGLIKSYFFATVELFSKDAAATATVFVYQDPQVRTAFFRSYLKKISIT